MGRSEKLQNNIPVESAGNYKVRTPRVCQRPLSHSGMVIFSQQDSGLLYTDKDYRTVRTRGESQKPLKHFLNICLPIYLIMHQYNPPYSLLTQGAAGVGQVKSIISHYVTYHPFPKPLLPMDLRGCNGCTPSPRWGKKNGESWGKGILAF